jgi:hypothetical protein
MEEAPTRSTFVLLPLATGGGRHGSLSSSAATEAGAPSPPAADRSSDPHATQKTTTMSQEDRANIGRDSLTQIGFATEVEGYGHTHFGVLLDFQSCRF